MLLSFQERISPEMERITFFHDFSMIVVVFICVLRAYFIFACLLVGSFDSYVMESHDLELI